MGRSKAPSLPIKALSFCRPTELRGWQRNWIHRGALRPANPVTCFPPGKVVAPATKGGLHFLARRAVVWFSHGRKPGCEGFIQTGAFYNLKAPYNNPRARGASNLSPLRTFGPAGRQPSSPQGLSIWRPPKPSAAKPLSILRTLGAKVPSVE